MDEGDFLTQQFENHRPHLRAVALRMLGSRSEAEDAVQESWLRLMRAHVGEIANMRGWLTTVVAHVCLDVLRARKTRPEQPITSGAEAVPADMAVDRELEIADAVGVGMLVVLEALTPAERVAFVLHDMFDIPFDDIASIIHRSPAAVRQLASRARRRVQGAGTSIDIDRKQRGEVVKAFLKASRDGDFSALLALLAPEAVLRADTAAVQLSMALSGAGAPVLTSEVRGRDAIATTFKGRAQAAQLALIDGEPGLVFAPAGRPRVVFDLVIEHDRIVEISLVADPGSIAALQLET